MIEIKITREFVVNTRQEAVDKALQEHLEAAVEAEASKIFDVPEEEVTRKQLDATRRLTLLGVLNSEQV